MPVFAAEAGNSGTTRIESEAVSQHAIASEVGLVGPHSTTADLPVAPDARVNHLLPAFPPAATPGDVKQIEVSQATDSRVISSRHDHGSLGIATPGHLDFGHAPLSQVSQHVLSHDLRIVYPESETPFLLQVARGTTVFQLLQGDHS